MNHPRLHRRALIASGLALAACGGRSRGEAPRGPAPPLKSLAPFPVGAAVASGSLSEPDYLATLVRHFSQITAEWEMKMERLLREDGSFDFTAADRLAAFAGERDLRLFGHTLVWYAQAPPAFARLLGDRAAFERAYGRYIAAVAGRYRGRVVGWDVVNEPIDDDGATLRGGYWLQALGPGYIDRAFEHARAADSDAVLFLNDYNLEQAGKRRSFLRLAEDLLTRGIPLGGLGTQCHLTLDTAPRDLAAMMRDLAGLGLPIHVSEFDVVADGAAGADAHARLAGALAERFAALPQAQRFAFTTWGVRDRDSWRRREDPAQNPLLFDDAGEPKPMFWAVADAWS